MRPLSLLVSFLEVMKSAFDEFIWEVSVYSEKTWLFYAAYPASGSVSRFYPVFGSVYHSVFRGFCAACGHSCQFPVCGVFFLQVSVFAGGRCLPLLPENVVFCNKCYSYKEEHAVLILIRYMKLWLMNKSNASVEK